MSKYDNALKNGYFDKPLDYVQATSVNKKIETVRGDNIPTDTGRLTLRRETVDRYLYSLKHTLMELENLKQEDENKRVEKGDVWWASFDDMSYCTEMRGEHPCIVVQKGDQGIEPADSSPRRFCNVIVAPISHAEKTSRDGNIPFTMLQINNDQMARVDRGTIEGYVDLGNLKSVSRARLKWSFGKIKDEYMLAIEGRLLRLFGIRPDTHNMYEKYMKQLARAELKEAQKQLFRAKVEEMRKIIVADSEFANSELGQLLMQKIMDTSNY